MALPLLLLFSSSTRVVGAAVDVVVGDATQVYFFLCLAWLPYSSERSLYFTHTTRQHSPLLCCVISLCVWHKSEWEQANEEWTEWLTRPACCSAGIYFILLYSNVECVNVCVAYTTTFDVCELVCVCVCVCARAALLFLIYVFVIGMFAHSKRALTTTTTTSTFPIRDPLSASSCSSHRLCRACMYVCMRVCMQLMFSCRLLFLFLLIFCTLSFRTRSRQFIVHFISLHLISQIPKRTTFYFPAIAVEPTSPSLSLSFSLFEFFSLLSLFAVGGTDNVDFAPFVILCDSNCCRFK